MTIAKTHWRWWGSPPPEEVMQDREALLRYEFSLIQKAYMEECEPVTKELAEIESMKPIRKFIVPYKHVAEWEAAQIMAIQKGGYIRTWFDGAEMRAEHIPREDTEK